MDKNGLELVKKPCFNDLPSELIIEVFSHLDYTDLINCSLLNNRIHGLCSHQVHWKRLCQKYWLETTCPPNRTWEEHFIFLFCDMGRYIHFYRSIKSAWNAIEDFVKAYCPVIYQAIKAGASEDELNNVESEMEFKLPEDLRCSYRIHNGQRLTSPGLMGSMSLHNHYKSESLLDIETMMAGFQARSGLEGCIPLTFCLHSGVTQYLAVTNQNGYDRNSVFYTCQSDLPDRNYPDAFITATSFEDWLVKYANNLKNNNFLVLYEQPFRFLQDPLCTETTGYFSVSVATCFIPELSKVFPPSFYHSYRITMSMSADAPESDSCQLETRHWDIVDDNGMEDHVNGQGVVGEYPIMYPGATFSWVSCTSFTTTYGNMKGEFKMRNLRTGDRINIKCPTFHMKCLPYITAEERESNILRNTKKDN